MSSCMDGARGQEYQTRTLIYVTFGLFCLYKHPFGQPSGADAQCPEVECCSLSSVPTDSWGVAGPDPGL